MHLRRKREEGERHWARSCQPQQSLPQSNNQVFILPVWGGVMVGEGAKDI